MSGSDDETLDPSDWEALRALGHRMLDDMIDHLRDVRQRPVWQAIPPETRARLREAPLPRGGEAEAAVYEQFRRDVLPHSTGNVHPRFWGWVMGNGTALAMLSEMLAAGMNCNVAGVDDAANVVEQQAISWCAEMLGYPARSGLFVSGGSMANLVGLTVARNDRCGYDVRKEGVYADARRLVYYGSREMHLSLPKSLELLGLGTESLRKLPVDGKLRMDLQALSEAIAADRSAGRQPICIIGTAGTTNSAAIDDLAGCAELAARERLWFHVDGAFGGLAALAPSLRPLVAGMERADSLAFDLHKWGWLPYEVGCTLTRHEDAHHRTFSFVADYIRPERPPEVVKYGEYGFQLSRSFRALKVWMSLKAHGVDKLARLVEQNVAQARYLAGLVEQSSELELMAPVSLNVVCFRYLRPGLGEAALDQLNEAILKELHRQGRFVPSHTTMGGRYALRASVTNHRSQRHDFDALVAEVLALGRQLAA